MIDGAYAVGPFLPYSDSLGGKGKIYSHSVEITAGDKSFHSMYMEGPMFLNVDLNGPYDKKETIVANYNRLGKQNLKFKTGEPLLKSVTLGSEVPAALHEEKKGSHRYLIGFHPELTCQAKTFIPQFEKLCIAHVMPMLVNDRNALMIDGTEASNCEFLRNTFTHLK